MKPQCPSCKSQDVRYRKKEEKQMICRICGHEWRVEKVDKSFSCVVVLISSLLCSGVFASDITIDLTKIAQIESSNNPAAYNSRTKATGLYQITPICLKDYNKFANKALYSHYLLKDMLDPEKAKIVANWYYCVRIPSLLYHYGHEDTIENRLIAYNCGISCVGRKLPRETINYIKKYKNGGDL